MGYINTNGMNEQLDNKMETNVANAKTRAEDTNNNGKIAPVPKDSGDTKGSEGSEGSDGTYGTDQYGNTCQCENVCGDIEINIGPTAKDIKPTEDGIEEMRNFEK